MNAPPLASRERIDRRRARAWALQAHYAWETGGASGALCEALVTIQGTRRVSPRRLPYVRRVLTLLDEHLPEVDRLLHECIENWRLERLSVIDRGVLRLAATEMLYMEDVPPRVIIQEGIQLAEQYGGPESPRFVNGVLDALFKRVRPQG